MADRKTSRFMALTMFVMVLTGAVLLGPSLVGGDQAHARLAINKNIIEIFAGGPPRADLELSNSGSEILYVTVTPSRIDNPGTSDEKRVTVPDPAELGLLATPRRLILKPGDRKIVRTTLLKRPKADDAIFRIHIEPKSSDFETDDQGMQVKIMIAYDVLVIARPISGKPEITANRTGKKLLLKNDGTTNALFYDGLQCNDAGEDCRILPTKRLYAGASHEMELYYQDTQVRFLVSDGRRSEVVEY